MPSLASHPTGAEVPTRCHATAMSPRQYRDGERCSSVSLAHADSQGAWIAPVCCIRQRVCRHRYSLFNEAFRDQRHKVCFAVKANSSLAILRMLAADFARGFDIVSGGELERVRLRGRRAALKDAGLFRRAASRSGRSDAALRGRNTADFNVESEEELGLLEQRARNRSLGRAGADSALRVNPVNVSCRLPFLYFHRITCACRHSG